MTRLRCALELTCREQLDPCWGLSLPARETNREEREKFSRCLSVSWKIHLLWLQGGCLICVMKLSDSRVKVVSIWTCAFIYLSSALSGTGFFKWASPSLWGSPDLQCLENLTANSEERGKGDTGRRTGRCVSRRRDSRSCANSRAQLWGKHTPNRSSFRWLHTLSASLRTSDSTRRSCSPWDAAAAAAVRVQVGHARRRSLPRKELIPSELPHYFLPNLSDSRQQSASILPASYLHKVPHKSK